MTTDTKTSPFVPGARVAVRHNRYDEWCEDFVDKVYKTGNFTLRGSSQQWRPSSHRPFSGGPLRWTGSKTTRSVWDTSHLVLWDATTDEELREAGGARKRKQRWIELRSRFERVREAQITDAMLDAIEAALPKAAP